MSSIIKIYIDIECQLYCDFEFVSDLKSKSLFRFEKRKGTYILQFKYGDIILEERKCTINSNNEEILLDISLTEQLSRAIREIKIRKVENKNCIINLHDSKLWIQDTDTKEEKEVINCEIPCWPIFGYDNAFDSCGLIAANQNPEENYGYCFVGGKWGCLNKNGNIQIPFIYDKEIRFRNKKTTVARLNNNVFFINKFGDITFPNIYDEVDDFCEENLKQTDKEFIETQSICIVKKGSKYGAINADGNIVFPVEYDSLKFYFSKHLTYVITCNHERYGLYDTFGRSIIPLVYDSFESQTYAPANTFIVSSNNLYGIINIKKEVILPLKYDSISYHRDCISIKINGKEGLLDKQYSEIVPPIYEVLNNSNCPIVKRDGKFGRINWSLFSGKESYPFTEIIPCEYDEIYHQDGKPCASYDYISSDDVFVKHESNLLHCFVFSESCDKSTISSIKREFICEEFVYEVYRRGETWYILNSNIESEIRPVIIRMYKNDCNVYSKEWIIRNKALYVYQQNESDLDKIIGLPGDDAKHLKGSILAIKYQQKWGIYDYENDNIIRQPIFDEITDFQATRMIDNRKLFYRLIWNEDTLIKISNNIPGTNQGTRPANNDGCSAYSPTYDEDRHLVVLKKDDSIILEVDQIYKIGPYFAAEYGSKYENGICTKRGNLCLFKIGFGKITEFIWNGIAIGDDYTIFVFKDSESNLWAYKYDKYIPLEFEMPLLNCRKLEIAPDVKTIKMSEIENFYSPIVNPCKEVCLYIDVETTGLPTDSNMPYSKTENWPRIVQVAFILEDKEFGIIAKRDFIIKPDGFTIPDASTKIHGISNDYAIKNGMDRTSVINFIDKIIGTADLIIGHNIMFDLRVIQAEICRLKRYDDRLFMKNNPKIIDTMILGQNICKIPSLKNFDDYKYPTLSELYECLFNEDFSNKHNALSDITATFRCYKKLIQKNDVVE